MLCAAAFHIVSFGKWKWSSHQWTAYAFITHCWHSSFQLEDSCIHIWLQRQAISTCIRLAVGSGADIPVPSSNQSWSNVCTAVSSTAEHFQPCSYLGAASTVLIRFRVRRFCKSHNIRRDCHSRFCISTIIAAGMVAEIAHLHTEYIGGADDNAFLFKSCTDVCI